MKPYKCSAGKLTIGVGRNLDENGISEGEALMLLYNDIDRCKRELAPYIPQDIPLNDERYLVLLNMTFNLGINRLLRFKKMWKALSKGKFDEAADEMKDSKWYHQVGRRAEELIEIMRTGERRV